MIDNKEKFDWDKSMAKYYTSVINSLDCSRNIVIELKKLKYKDPVSKEYSNDVIKRIEKNIIEDEIWVDKFRKTLKQLPSIK